MLAMLLAAGLYAGCLIFAALCDLKARRIPNSVALATACFAATLAWLAGPRAALPLAHGTSALLFLILFLMWTRGWLGGGDVKLLTAASLAAANPVEVGIFLLVVAVGGGALAFAVLAWRHLAPLVLAALIPLRLAPPLLALTESSRDSTTLPYAVAIALGGLWLAGARLGWTQGW